MEENIRIAGSFGSYPDIHMDPDRRWRDSQKMYMMRSSRQSKI